MRVGSNVLAQSCWYLRMACPEVGGDLCRWYGNGTRLANNHSQCMMVFE